MTPRVWAGERRTKRTRTQGGRTAALLIIRFAQVDQPARGTGFGLALEDCASDIRPPLGWSKSDALRYGAFVRFGRAGPQVNLTEPDSHERCCRAPCVLASLGPASARTGKGLISEIP